MAERVTVVATVRDEVESVEWFLDALAAQTRPADEVVVVDGGSSDGTFAVLTERAARWPQLTVLRADGTTISAGRNCAVRAATGSVVAVTDAGAEADPEWLERIVGPLVQDPALGVASGYFRPGGRTWFERSLGAIITPHLSEIRADTFLPSSRSVAFRRSWWEEAGGYPEWLTHCEDLVFDLELRRVGARFAFVPDAMVTWRSRPSLRRFFRQYYLYGRGDGDAGLWPRRHLVRYGSYAGGAALVAPGPHRRARVAVAGSLGAIYLAKFLRRTKRHLEPRALPAAWALAPVVVVTGDVAKMVGYPVGRARRRRRVRRGAASAGSPGGTRHRDR
jgi:glycosyltransferase involved in cell wall biosynthesis